MSYSLGQQLTLALLPKFAGTIGFASSAFLASELIRDMVNGEGHAIKRALLAVCIFEMADSFGWFLSTWAIPYSEGSFPFSVGTTSSCNFQGFLLQLVIGAPLNFLQMTYYFYLVVVKRQSIDALGVKQWKAHLVLDAYTIGSALLLIFLGHFNPMGHICYINGYPSGCNEAVFDGKGVGECIRGANSHITGLVLFYIPLWICMIAVCYFNWLMRGYLIANNSTEVSWMTRQTLFYALAFLVTWIPSTIWNIMAFTNGVAFWIELLAAFFEPFQGFWNMLIFLCSRPDSVERLKLLLSCKACSHRKSQGEEEDYNQEKITKTQDAVIDTIVEIAVAAATNSNTVLNSSSSSTDSNEGRTI
jgi:G protein-coupled glucose receptor regulating Gpa2 C-term